MSDSDVDTGGMGTRRLSDSDAEALISGRPVEGVPSELGDMLSTMREQAASGPGVPISGALAEFIVESAPSVTPIGAASSMTSLRGSRRIAKKAAAGFAIVPAKILIGATMAAAAVGGAQAFGIVDVPLLPGPEPVVVTTVPVEIVPPTTSAASARPTTTTVAPSTTTVASVPASTVSGAIIPVPSTVNEARVTSPPTVPTQAAVDGTSGCDFGQETSGRPDGESNADAPDQRPDVALNTAVPQIDPCKRGGPDQTRPSAPVDTMPSVPAAPSRGTGTPSSVPDNNGANPGGGAPAQSPGDNSGNASGERNGAASDRVPASGQGGNDNSGGGSVSTTSPPRNSGQGRTPPGN